jgi:hypothetical protein
LGHVREERCVSSGADPTDQQLAIPRAQHRRARSIEAAAVAGIAYALLAGLALVRLSQFPSLEQSEAALTAWFDDATHQAWLVGALTAASFSAIAFLWFVAVIRRRLGDKEDKFFATVFFGSGIAYVAIWLAGATALAAPAVAPTLVDGASVSPDSASLAAGVGAGLLLVVAPRLQAVFIFSTSTVILRSRVLPKWLAYVGYFTGLVMLVMPLVTEPVGAAFPVWVLVVSIVILINRPRALGEQLGATGED